MNNCRLISLIIVLLIFLFLSLLPILSGKTVFQSLFTRTALYVGATPIPGVQIRQQQMH